MSHSAEEYGSISSFQAPSLSTESLGFAISTISSTLTATKLELSDGANLPKRTVRDVCREARSALDDIRFSNEQWFFYESTQVLRLKWSWDKRGWEEAGAISPNAVGVAMRRNIFGEGAERMVRKFREVDGDGLFVGPKLVAKESRFIEDLRSRNLIKFHEVFCKTQRLAEEFNARLATLPGVCASTPPRVAFLDCSVFALDDVRQGIIGVLVEKMLDPTRYKKWNGNNGFVAGVVPADQTAPAARAAPLEHRDGAAPAAAKLEVIGELDSEEEDSEGDGEGDELEDNRYGPELAVGAALRIVAEDVPQAFSHFTYRQTRRKMLVCDLQGVLTTAGSPHLFELTDPVIHYSSGTGRSNVFGRTDRGRKGIHDFFRTHRCSALCRALNRRWLTPLAEAPTAPAGAATGLVRTMASPATAPTPPGHYHSMPQTTALHPGLERGGVEAAALGGMPKQPVNSSPSPYSMPRPTASHPGLGAAAFEVARRPDNGSMPRSTLTAPHAGAAAIDGIVGLSLQPR
jgi:hypothetical protein